MLKWNEILMSSSWVLDIKCWQGPIGKFSSKASRSILRWIFRHRKYWTNLHSIRISFSICTTSLHIDFVRKSNGTMRNWACLFPLPYGILFSRNRHISFVFRKSFRPSTVSIVGTFFHARVLLALCRRARIRWLFLTLICFLLFTITRIRLNRFCSVSFSCSQLTLTTGNFLIVIFSFSAAILFAG